MSNMGFASVADFAPTTAATAVRTMAVSGVGASSEVVQGASLGLNFITAPVDGPVLDSRITFTRSGNAWAFNSAGTLTQYGTNVARFDYDPSTLACKGLLLEEQRINLLLNNTTLSTQSVTVAANSYALSFYGTGTITLSGTYTGTLVGTGAFPTRSTLIFTPTAGTLTLTVSGTVQYAQLEAGSFATSVIITAGTSVTRNADLAVMTGTSFSDWYSQSAGTVIIEFQSITNGKNVTGGNGFPFLYDIDNTSTNNITLIASNGYGPGIEAAVSDAGVTQAALRSTVALGDGLVKKHALAYAVNDFAACVNGESVLTDTAGTVPSGMTRLTLGAQNATVGTNNFTGYIRRFVFYPRRMSNSALQAITS